MVGSILCQRFSAVLPFLANRNLHKQAVNWTPTVSNTYWMESNFIIESFVNFQLFIQIIVNVLMSPHLAVMLYLKGLKYASPLIISVLLVRNTYLTGCFDRQNKQFWARSWHCISDVLCKHQIKKIKQALVVFDEPWEG